MLFTLKECFKMSCGGFVRCQLDQVELHFQEFLFLFVSTGEPQWIPLEDLESRKEAASILYFGLSKMLTQPCWLKAASTSALDPSPPSLTPGPDRGIYLHGFCSMPILLTSETIETNNFQSSLLRARAPAGPCSL